MKLSRIAVSIAVLLLAGCAFNDATLDVRPSADLRVAGPLGEVKSVAFSAPQLEDARLDRARIGWKKNGYGQNTADITTFAPPDEIVEAAVTKALTDTNHRVGGSDGDVQIVGTVDRMWFDVDVNFWTVKFIGDIQATLEFIDKATSKPIYKSRYTGSYNEAKGGGLEKTWTIIMNKALDKLVESIVLDDELAAALAARGQGAQ